MKTKNLLRKAFLLLALVGGVNSVGAATVDDLVTISSDYTFIADGVTADGTSKLTANTLYDKGRIFTPTGNSVATNKGNCTFAGGTHLNSLRLKNTQDQLCFKVSGACTVTFYTQSHASRGLQVGSTAGGTEYGTQTVSTSEFECEISAGGVVYLSSFSGDFYIAGFVVTFPPSSEVPAITSDLASSADVYVGVAQEFSISASGATSYQWYKASSTTADIKKDAAIDGATSSSYSYTATSAGTEYLYCAAINAIGTTLSKVCAVTATATAFHSVTYSLGSGSGTVPTQADVAEENTFTVADAPGDLVPPSGKEFKCWNDGANDYNAGDAYTMSTSDVTLTAVYQDRTYKGLTPAVTMDFANPGVMFASVWTTANNLKENFYFDPVNGVAAISAYAIYQIKRGTWMDTDSGNSIGDTWDATDDFMGSDYYFNSSSKAATVRATERMHYYRVKGITGVSALMGGKAKMEAYLVTDGVVSADPVSENSIDAAGILSVADLNTSNEYIIKVYGDNGNSNVLFREIAFMFTPVMTVTGTFPEKGIASLASAYALDLSGVEAYVIKEIGIDSRAMCYQITEAPANTGIILVGTPKAEYSIPVVASATLSVNNLLKAAVEATDLEVGDAILKDGAFCPIINASTLAAGKAYLPAQYVPVESGAKGISLSFGEITGISEAEAAEAPVAAEGKFIENGKLVIVKSGKKFNANGARIY